MVRICRYLGVPQPSASTLQGREAGEPKLCRAKQEPRYLFPPRKTLKSPRIGRAVEVGRSSPLTKSPNHALLVLLKLGHACESRAAGVSRRETICHVQRRIKLGLSFHQRSPVSLWGFVAFYWQCAQTTSSTLQNRPMNAPLFVGAHSFPGHFLLCGEDKKHRVGTPTASL